MITLYQYNGKGEQEYTVVDMNQNGQIDFAGADRITRTVVDAVYNHQGLLTSVANAYGVLFAADYDIFDRPMSITDANGVTSIQIFEGLGRLTSRSWLGGSVREGWDYTFNMAGPTAYTSPGDKTIFSIYDTLGQITDEFIQMWGYSSNHFTYNYAGDLQTFQDANGHITTWHYNAYGQVTNKVDANSNTSFICQYDANGRLTNRWTPGKGTTSFTYDAAGNMTYITHPSSPSISLAYDALGRLTNMVDGIGTTRFTYDTNGFLASEDGPWVSDTLIYQTANALRTSLSLEQPGGGAWNQSYGYDNANRLLNMVSPAGTFGYEYTGASGTTVPGALIKKLTLPNGLYVTNVYDTMARWTGTYLKNSSQATLLSHEYIYNTASERTRYTRFNGSYIDYAYDYPGECMEAKGYEAGGTPRLQEQFRYYYYDGAGSLVYRSKNGVTNWFSYNNLNQLTTSIRASTMTVAGTASSLATNVTINGQQAELYADKTFALAGVSLVDGTNTFTAVARDGYGRTNADSVTLNLPVTTSYQYDANGNLTGDGVRVFYYDDENQLTNVTVANAWKVKFAYDGLGRRRLTRDYDLSGGTPVLTNEVRYLYDGLLVIQERDSNNVPKVTYTRGLDLSGSLQGAGGIGGLLARSEAYNAGYWSTNLVYFADGNGNVTALIGNNPINRIDPLGLFESHWLLRWLVPGQIAWDNVLTAVEEKKYANAASWGGVMVADQALFIGSFGSIKYTPRPPARCPPTKALRLPATDANLAGTGTRGYTTPDGRVFLRPGMSRAMQVSTLEHESVHVFFTLLGSGTITTFRQIIGQFGYDNSQFLRYTEEALAQTYASGSLIQGLRFPLANGYASYGGLIREAAIGGARFAGAVNIAYSLRRSE